MRKVCCISEGTISRGDNVRETKNRWDSSNKADDKQLGPDFMAWIQVTFAFHKGRGFLEHLNRTFRESSSSCEKQNTNIKLFPENAYGRRKV
jgi:hypothetical protein